MSASSPKCEPLEGRVWFTQTVLSMVPETGSVFTGALWKKRKGKGGKKRDKGEGIMTIASGSEIILHNCFDWHLEESPFGDVVSLTEFVYGSVQEISPVSCTKVSMV